MTYVRLTLLISGLLVISVSYFLVWNMGANFSAKKSHLYIDSVQAGLTINYLEDLEKIKMELSSECLDRAVSRISHGIRTQKMLLKVYFDSHDDPDLRRYIQVRDPSFFSKLKNINVDWTSTTNIPECSNLDRKINLKPEVIEYVKSY